MQWILILALPAIAGLVLRLFPQYREVWWGCGVGIGTGFVLQWWLLFQNAATAFWATSVAVLIGAAAPDLWQGFLAFLRQPNVAGWIVGILITIIVVAVYPQILVQITTGILIFLLLWWLLRGHLGGGKREEN